MLKVNFYELNTIEDSKLKFAVIMTKFNGQWLYVRHKNRNTWEIPGGHREKKKVLVMLHQENYLRKQEQQSLN